MVVGIVIIGLGIALFKQSHLGNDSISALNMRLAEMLGISLGVQNLCTVPNAIRQDSAGMNYRERFLFLPSAVSASRRSLNRRKPRENFMKSKWK